MSDPIYYANWTQPELIPLAKEELLSLKWETKRTARQEYFMSSWPRAYTYGGAYPTTYSSKPFSEMVENMKRYLNQSLHTEFNVCFLNRYDDEKNHLGWHADDFVGMRPDQPIAVISFGAEREIWVKPKGFKGEIPDNWRFPLKDGSLFMMPVGYQDTHLHRIPKHDKPCGWRISLTFRSFRDEV